MIIESDIFVKKPLVSVIVFTYNQEKYIIKTIESILFQICDFKYELIIAEDCGTDRTREICVDYQKKYPQKIKLLLQDSNKGIMGNYLDVLNLCRGEYIAQCAGDDYWTDTLKLQKQKDFLESHKEYGLIFTDTDFYYVGKDKYVHAVFQNNYYKRYDNFDDYLIYKGYLAPNTWMYKKQFSPTQFNYTKKYVDESFVYMLDILQTTKIYFLSEVTAMRRKLADSASTPLNKRKSYDREVGLGEIQIEYMEKYGMDIQIKDKIKSTYYLRLLKDSILYDNQVFIDDAKSFFENKMIKFNDLLNIYNQYILLEKEINGLRKSKSYRLGKFLLKPLLFIKKVKK